MWKSALNALSVASHKAEVSLCVFQFASLPINVTFLTDGLTTPIPLLKEHHMVWLRKVFLPLGRPPAVLFYQLLKIMQ